MNIEKAVHHEEHKEKQKRIRNEPHNTVYERPHDEILMVFFVHFVVQMRF